MDIKIDAIKLALTNPHASIGLAVVLFVAVSYYNLSLSTVAELIDYCRLHKQEEHNNIFYNIQISIEY